MTIFTRTYNTDAGPIGPRRILAFTATGTIKRATGPTDKLCGISDNQLDSPANGRIDVQHSGPGVLDAGGAIKWGDRLTSDAQGRAVVAGPGEKVIAMALEDAALDDRFEVFIIHSLA